MNTIRQRDLFPDQITKEEKKVAINALKDYETQKKDGKNPVFYGRNIGLSEDQLDFWK